VSTITGYKDVTPESDAQMMAAVAEGPVSVAIEADQRAFQSYKSGVFSGLCGTKLDHGVLAVGYTADAWIVKNSWGEVSLVSCLAFPPLPFCSIQHERASAMQTFLLCTYVRTQRLAHHVLPTAMSSPFLQTWGTEGYIQLSRSVGGAKGQCGILVQPSYPLAGNAPPAPPGPPGPAPPPPPSPPSPPGPSAGHYGDPKAGCASDEESVQITGVAGDFCSPKCTGVLFKKCPTDVPGERARALSLPLASVSRTVTCARCS
jgi:hypothetical protein